MEVKELQSKSVSELRSLINDLKAELFTLRFKNATGQLDQPHKIKLVKRDIARVFTIIAQRQDKPEQTQDKAAPVKKKAAKKRATKVKKPSKVKKSSKSAATKSAKPKSVKKKPARKSKPAESKSGAKE
ncbi:50S ribosomal protein L29 [Mycoplasma sp. ATU-Cv-508]|uniref:50S ribosomal protein L29 n=1 Tax=Mycoplasma sp. ATU-Cv-508 TaxID=2048001 RepID=UPI000FDF522B